MEPSIQLQDDLASYPQVNLFIYQLLTAAQVGGLTESRARELDSEIHGYFANIQGDLFWTFREEMIRVLVTPDKSLVPMHENPEFCFTGNMN